MSRKSATIFGQGTIPEPSASHIGKGVALVALAAAFVYIYARIPQIAEMTLSFYATPGAKEELAVYVSEGLPVTAKVFSVGTRTFGFLTKVPLHALQDH